METNRLSFRSVLLPTMTMITSLPRSARTSSTHLVVFMKEVRSAQGERRGRGRGGGKAGSAAISPQIHQCKRLTRDVVHDYCHAGIANVGRNERTESLLSRGVPELKAHGAILEVHRLGEEVDACAV